MNANAVHEFLLGDRQLHARFSMAIELLARVAVAAPHPVRAAAALSAALGQPRMVRILLANLQQSGLLCRHERAKDAWCGAGLESPRMTQACDEPRGSSQQGIELLLMQAIMQINQVVLQHLQTFDLGRLKAVGPATARPRFDSSTRAYIAEPV
jgi:hypothetical protein